MRVKRSPASGALEALPELAPHKDLRGNHGSQGTG